MIFFYVFIVIGICFIIFLQTYWIWHLHQMRRDGKMPPRGKATMFDVRNLLQVGERELAIRLYCEIFRVSYREAKKNVDELDRSLKT